MAKRVSTIFTGYYNVTLSVTKDDKNFHIKYPMVGHPETNERLGAGESQVEATRMAQAAGYTVNGVVNTERCYDSEGG